MNQHSLFSSRLPALVLVAALAGCGAGDPAPATQTMSRSAASVTSSTAQTQEAYANALQHLYIAHFGRPAEPAGMYYWNRQLQLAGAPAEPTQLAAHYRSSAQVRLVFDSFAGSGESRALYPGETAQFVDGIYRNLFNRTADLPGLAWWSNAIDTGVITRSEAAMMIMLGARNEDALAVGKKVAVAQTFYRLLMERTSSVLAYTGDRNNEIARRMLAMVDANTDLAAFEAVIRATIAQMDTLTVD